MLLRLGYVLLVSALAVVVGYGVYWAVRLLLGLPGIPLFLKVAIALALVGLVLVIAGLVREKSRQGKEV
ncbi:hypothetical protein J7K76_06730 [Candidatus Bipolaricaulota bacterium]|nr:hypothetical protein [Candidatus Bipolaricaulota bacterium]RLE28670.1 MAG: hypothetical protein DRJ27_05715 [Candidatus Acetothermia bacterium]RLE33638.1 MAG: hypothetical protein DRJ58_03350 [Candidatus Acetothermia bacterium]HDC92233.1 hypothetical protein [Candidatus Acetothermia bacterium]